MGIDWTKAKFEVGPEGYTTGNLNPWSSRCVQHEITQALITYDDGVLTGYCIHCRDRIVLKKIPAGDLPARVRGLLREASSGVSPTLSQRITELRSELAQIGREVEDATELLRLVDALVEKHPE